MQPASPHATSSQPPTTLWKRNHERKPIPPQVGLGRAVRGRPGEFSAVLSEAPRLTATTCSDEASMLVSRDGYELYLRNIGIQGAIAAGHSTTVDGFTMVEGRGPMWRSWQAPASPPGVPGIPEAGRPRLPRRRAASGDGQLRHPPTDRGPGLLAANPRFTAHFTPTSGSG